MLTFKEAKSQLSSQQKSTNLIHNCLFLSRVPFKEISCTRTFQETSLRPCYDMLKTRDSEWLNYYLFTFERSAQGRWVCNDACNLVRALVCREYLHEFLKKETKLKRFFFISDCEVMFSKFVRKYPKKHSKVQKHSFLLLKFRMHL